LSWGLPDFDGIGGHQKVREWSEMPIMSFPPATRIGKAARWTTGPTIILQAFFPHGVEGALRVGLRHLHRADGD
jgi:hypothetical protein